MTEVTRLRTTVEIENPPNNTVKVYHQEANRRIQMEDINTLSGSSLPDSQLELLLLLTRTLARKNPGQNAAFGFGGLVHDGKNINIGAGLLVTENAVYRLGNQQLTPAPEAAQGCYEMELTQEKSDPVARDFFRADSGTWNTTSPSRKQFRIRLYESYSTTPENPPAHETRIRLLDYRKKAAYQELESATLAIQPDLDLIGLRNRIDELRTYTENKVTEILNTHHNAATVNAMIAGSYFQKAPVGTLHQCWVHMRGVAIPPVNAGWVWLDTGHNVPGGYNHEKIASESVTGVFPRETAVAVVSDQSSPMFGQQLHLIDREGRFLRGGASGLVKDDALEMHHHKIKSGRAVAWGGGARSTFAASLYNDGNPADYAKEIVGGRSDYETRPRFMGVGSFLKIKTV